MRLLLVSHYAIPHTGGVETVCDGLAEQMAARGHEVVHVASDAGPEGREPSPAGYRVVRVPALNVLERRLGVPYPLFSPRLLGVLRRELARADVVHAHGFLYQGTLAALALRRGGRPAVVMSEHVGHVPYASRTLDHLEAAAIATLGRAALQAVDHVVVCNRTVEALVRRLVPGKPLSWIANGVDPDRFRPPEPGEHEALRARLGWDARPRVLFVGRAVAKKGLDVAAAAVARAGGGAVLAVAGQERLADGLPGVAEPLGEVSSDAMAGIYRAADVLLLPSIGEGLPMACQEAMLSGLPVVMTDDPGYREVLAPTAPAVRLLPQDPDLMGAAVAELLADDAARRAASQAARRHAVERFSLRRVADEHEALYASLLERR